MNENLSYDRTGLNLTESSEGLSLKAYPDPGTGGAPWTIGWGHTGSDVYEGLAITRERAEALLIDDIKSAEHDVHSFVKVALNQHQYDALVDFSFNVGGMNFRGSTLLRLLNAGDFAGADAEFKKWNKGGGKVLSGLVTRRNNEATFFAS